MKFLVDQCIKPDVASLLSAAGHESLHTSRLGLERASDVDLFDIARTQSRVFLTADKRLLKYIAEQNATDPSIILIRGYLRDIDALPDIIATIPAVEQANQNGDQVIVSVRHNKFTRLETLPLKALS